MLDAFSSLVSRTVFFSDRFAEAFPGCRHVLVIDDPAEAVRRLDILLQKPLSVEIEQKGGSFGVDPIWWFRGWQNAPIRSYRRARNYFLMPTNDILFNEVELHRVRRVVAFGFTSYRAKVVYVETDGVPPSGFYGQQSSEYAKERGYEYEEVGIYRGSFIRREEYDDGAAVINGRVVRTLGKAKLQVRYLSPFNFLIAPVGSLINNSNYDEVLEEALKVILQGRMAVEELAELFRKFRRNPRENFRPQRDAKILAGR
jgi:hypothetical protein